MSAKSVIDSLRQNDETAEIIGLDIHPKEWVALWSILLKGKLFVPLHQAESWRSAEASFFGMKNYHRYQELK